MSNSAISFNTAGLASTTSPGLVGTGAQTFAGAKTFQNGLVFTSASLSDSQATIMGLKQYVHGTTYNGGLAPTVTCTQGGFAVVRAVFVPYQAQDGSWRMRFNITSTHTLASVASLSVNINGVVFKNVSNNLQSVTSFINSSGSPNASSAYVAGSNFVQLQAAGTTTSNTLGLSGDVELDAKPTWAY